MEALSTSHTHTLPSSPLPLDLPLPPTCPRSWVREQTGGISYIDHLKELSKRVESDWEGVEAELKAIRAALLNR
jgi:hypothetical protein